MEPENTITDAADANLTDAPDAGLPDAAGQENADMLALKEQLASAQKAKRLAEEALKNEKSAHSRLKREQMTDAEQLAEQRREMEENAKKYQRLMAGAKAREVFAGSGLTEAEYAHALELITSEDEARTEEIAQEIKIMLANQAKTIEKTVREKVLKETPAPPAASGAFSSVSPQKFAEMNYRERMELFEKDPETYKKLNGGV